MKIRVRMKCPNCSFWNIFEVEKFVEQEGNSEQNVEDNMPTYEALKIES